jgi:hypothetical protein
MKKKTSNIEQFIKELHEYIIGNEQFRINTKYKTESQIQTEIRPLIINFLINYFKGDGFKDPEAKANKSFYWEGQEGRFGKNRETIFASRNYPDFIITKPYLIAIEYKKSSNGSIVKHGIGQSMMYTLSGDFDYVYYLFYDENKDKKILKSIENNTEKDIIEKIWKEYNVNMKII